jgi:hypothetical protein
MSWSSSWSSSSSHAGRRSPRSSSFGQGEKHRRDPAGSTPPAASPRRSRVRRSRLEHAPVSTVPRIAAQEVRPSRLHPPAHSDTPATRCASCVASGRHRTGAMVHSHSATMSTALLMGSVEGLTESETRAIRIRSGPRRVPITLGYHDTTGHLVGAPAPFGASDSGARENTIAAVRSDRARVSIPALCRRGGRRSQAGRMDGPSGERGTRE